MGMRDYTAKHMYSATAGLAAVLDREVRDVLWDMRASKNEKMREFSDKATLAPHDLPFREPRTGDRCFRGHDGDEVEDDLRVVADCVDCSLFDVVDVVAGEDVTARRWLNDVADGRCRPGTNDIPVWEVRGRDPLTDTHPTGDWREDDAFAMRRYAGTARNGKEARAVANDAGATMFSFKGFREMTEFHDFTEVENAHYRDTPKAPDNPEEPVEGTEKYAIRRQFYQHHMTAKQRSTALETARRMHQKAVAGAKKEEVVLAGKNALGAQTPAIHPGLVELTMHVADPMWRIYDPTAINAAADLAKIEVKGHDWQRGMLKDLADTIVKIDELRRRLSPPER